MKKNTKRAGRRAKTIDATNNIQERIESQRNKLKPRSENQREYIRNICDNSITFCQGAAGSGKALTLQSKLFTKTGPITMGEVRIGDEIADPDGNFSKVLAIYPQGKKRVYRVHFSNGSHVDCCEEHLWSISRDGTKHNKRIVVNTKYLESNCRRQDGKRILSIPCTQPVNFNRKEYLIDPYALGILISEGGLTNSNVVFTTCEPEVLARVGDGINDDYCIKTRNIDHRIVKRKSSSNKNFYKEELKALNLWGKYAYEKHIPDTYKYGAVDQRLALLQGLMDGDGTISKGGAISYCTTSYQLAQDFCELIYSLGGTTRIRIKAGQNKPDGTKYRKSYNCHVCLPNSLQIFFLDRKNKRRINRTKYLPKLYVDRVEQLDYEEMQCITVDHADSLYLTDNYIPTHNTHCAVGLALEHLLDDKVKKIVITRPIVESGPGMGYLPGPQPLDAKVLTPNGWTTMGEIQTGDFVISRDGLPTKVLGIFPKGKKKVFSVTTTDGRTTECCEDHLWLTQTAGDIKHQKVGSVKSTAEILSSLQTKHDKNNHFLPMNEPVQFISQKLPLAPYALGVLLGDGSLSHYISFASMDQEIIDKVNSEVADINCSCKKESSNRISYRINSNILFNKKSARTIKITNTATRSSKEYSSIGSAATTLNVCSGTLASRCRRSSTIDTIKYEFLNNKPTFTNPIKDILHKLNLLGKRAIDKYIPDMYKYSKIEDRIELLRGLLDTDGSINKNTGEVSFCTISHRLALDMIELVQSLGGKAKLRSRNRIGKTSKLKNTDRSIVSRHISYEFTISLPNGINPFYLPRKASLVRDHLKQHHIGIAQIKEVGEKETQCIRVQNPEHLYITDNYIVTHNTAEEKIHPYLLPILDEVNYFISQAQYASLKLNNKIEIVPLGLMRGRNFNQCFIVADECQNASYEQLKMLITRLGKDSKMVLTGDIGQSDLQKHLQGGFLEMVQQLEPVEGIAVSRLQFSDIVRNPIIAKILMVLDAYENETTK